MGRIRKVGCVQRGTNCQKFCDNNVFFESLLSVYNPQKHSLPTPTNLVLVESFEHPDFDVRDLVKSQSTTRSWKTRQQMLTDKIPDGLGNSSESEIEWETFKENTNKALPKRSSRRKSDTPKTTANNTNEPDADANDVPNDGLIINEELTDKLHRFVNTDLIRKSLTESPVLWKTSSQINQLSEKHYAAICGVIMSNPTPQVKGKTKVKMFSKPSSITNGLRRTKGQIVKHTIHSKIKKKVPKPPESKKKKGRQSKSVKEKVFQETDDETEGEEENDLTQPGVLGKRRGRRKVSEVTARDPSPEPVDTKPSKSKRRSSSTSASVKVTPVKSVEPKSSQSGSTGSSNRVARTKVPTGQSSNSKPISEYLADEEKENANTNKPSKIDPTPIVEKVPCADCGGDTSSNTRIRAQTVQPPGVCRPVPPLCLSCSTWLSRFLKPLRFPDELACILYRPCHSRDTPQDSSSMRCKPCRAQHFVELGVPLVNYVVPRAPNVGLLSEVDLDVLRSPAVVHRARERRCTEYSLFLTRRHADTPRDPWPRSVKDIETENVEAVADKYNIDPARVALLSKNVPFTCDVCQETPSSQEDVPMYMVEGQCHLCTPCLTRCQKLLDCPPPDFSPRWKPQTNEHKSCSGASMCDLCFLFDCSNRFPFDAVWFSTLHSKLLLSPTAFCGVCRCSPPSLDTSNASSNDTEDTSLNYYRLMGGAVVCELCLWTYKATVATATKEHVAKCPAQGECDPLKCSSCLVSICRTTLPFDPCLELPKWVTQPHKPPVPPPPADPPAESNGRHSATDGLVVNGKRQRKPKKFSDSDSGPEDAVSVKSSSTTGRTSTTSITSKKMPAPVPPKTAGPPRAGPRVKHVSREVNAVKNGENSSSDENDFRSDASKKKKKGESRRGDGGGSPCGKCPGCCTYTDCGDCPPCKLMKKFGGKGTDKMCLDRVCQRIKGDGRFVRKGGPRVKMASGERRSLHDTVPSLYKQLADSSVNLLVSEANTGAGSEEENLDDEIDLDNGEEAEKIRPVYGEVIDGSLAYEGGNPVVTSAAAAPPKEICYSCASAGGQMLFCVSCAEPFHFYCLDRQFRPKRKDHFVCRNCTTCLRCRVAGSDLRCRKCCRGYHPECLADYLPAQAVDRSNFTCPECAVCSHCEAKASVLGADKWSSLAECCAVCAGARAKGDLCPVCERAYNDSTEQMIECDGCHKWLHRVCAKLSDDQYEILGTLPDSRLSKLKFLCTGCERKSTLPSGGEQLRQLASNTLMERMTSFVNGISSEERALVERERQMSRRNTSRDNIPQLDGVMDSDLWSGEEEEDTNPIPHKTTERERLFRDPRHREGSSAGDYSRTSSGEHDFCASTDEEDELGRSQKAAMSMSRAEEEDVELDLRILSSLMIRLSDFAVDLTADGATASHIVKSAMIRLMVRLRQCPEMSSEHLIYTHLLKKVDELARHVFPWITVDKFAAQCTSMIDKSGSNLSYALSLLARERSRDLEKEMLALSKVPLSRLEKSLVRRSVKEDTKWMAFWSEREEEVTAEYEKSKSLPPSNDLRRCVLCLMGGDLGWEGRLVYCGHDMWIHVNCALWSNEVYEEEDGLLIHLSDAIHRGRSNRCKFCDSPGATLTCCYEGGSKCDQTMHFPCALRRGAQFTGNRTVYCSKSHLELAEDDRLLRPEDLLVCRRVVVAHDAHSNSCCGSKTRPFLFDCGLKASDMVVTVGALRVENLGKLCEASDSTEDHLLPVQFKCRRIFWSTSHLDERQTYILRIDQQQVLDSKQAHLSLPHHKPTTPSHSLPHHKPLTPFLSSPPQRLLPQLSAKTSVIYQRSHPPIQSSVQGPQKVPSFTSKSSAPKPSLLYPLPQGPSGGSVSGSSYSGSSGAMKTVSTKTKKPYFTKRMREEEVNRARAEALYQTQISKEVSLEMFTQPQLYAQPQEIYTQPEEFVSMKPMLLAPPKEPMEPCGSRSRHKLMNNYENHRHMALLSGSKPTEPPPKLYSKGQSQLIGQSTQNHAPFIVQKLPTVSPNQNSSNIQPITVSPNQTFSNKHVNSKPIVIHQQQRSSISPNQVYSTHHKSAQPISIPQRSSVSSNKNIVMISNNQQRSGNVQHIHLQSSNLKRSSTGSTSTGVPQPPQGKRMCVTPLLSTAASYSRLITSSSVPRPVMMLSNGMLIRQRTPFLPKGGPPPSSIAAPGLFQTGSTFKLSQDLDGILNKVIFNEKPQRVSDPSPAPRIPSEPPTPVISSVFRISRTDGSPIKGSIVDTLPQVDGSVDVKTTEAKKKKRLVGKKEDKLRSNPKLNRVKKWMLERENKKKLDQIALKAKRFKRQRMYRAEAEVHARRFCLKFIVDGISESLRDPRPAWKKVIDKVRSLRKSNGLPGMISPCYEAWTQFGVNHRHLVYIIEQMAGAFHCYRYKFQYHTRRIDRLRELFTPPEPIPEGSARLMACKKKVQPKHIARDPFDFLLCQANKPPRKRIPHQQVTNDPDTTLTMAVQFRELVSGKIARSTNVNVYRSHIHARGLFALREFSQDEMVSEYLGELIRSSVCEVRETRYRDCGVDCYMFRVDSNWVIDATMQGNVARFINHSCQPNCYAKIITVDGDKHIIIFAQRRIYPGEELTYDYRFPKEDEKLLCNCGTFNCKRYLN